MRNPGAVPTVHRRKTHHPRFQLKRLQVAGLAAALAIAAPQGVEAQNGVFRLPVSGGSRQATSPPAAPAAQPGQAPLYPRHPIAHTVVPAVIMSDGSIYANFGFGYVPIRQSCARAPRVLGSNGALHTNAAPPTYTQPVPNQATASQQMARGQSSAAQGAIVHTRHVDACYRMDAYGPVVVVR